MTDPRYRLRTACSGVSEDPTRVVVVVVSLVVVVVVVVSVGGRIVRGFVVLRVIVHGSVSCMDQQGSVEAADSRYCYRCCCCCCVCVVGDGVVGVGCGFLIIVAVVAVVVAVVRARDHSTGNIQIISNC